MSFKRLLIKLLPSVRPVIYELPIIITFFILARVWLLFTDGEERSLFSQLCIIGFWCLYAYIISASIYYTQQKWVKWLWYFLLFSIFAISVFLWNNFSMDIGPTPLLLLAETNIRESNEFFQTFLFSDASMHAYTKIIIFIILAIVLEFTYKRYILKRIYISGKNTITSSLLLLCLGLGFFQCKHYLAYFQLGNGDILDDISAPAPDIYSKLLISPCVILSSNNTMQNAIKKSLEAENVTTTLANSDSLNIILVIGESYIKPHAQIYGYKGNTTPIMSELKEKGNLFAFSDVSTPFNLTSPTIKNIMSCNNLSKSEKWYEYPYFPTKFKKAGYDVYFWDNQRYMYRGALLEFTLNSYLYNDSLSEVTYTKTNSEAFEYDGPLIEDFKHQVNLASTKHNLIMFHLFGQHFKASSRYPHSQQFEHFSANNINRNEPYLTQEKLQEIAEYDNATLYNDYVIGQIIDLFSSKNAVLVYFSDHGEEIYDYRDFKGRSSAEPLTRQILNHQYSVPFVIWCSDTFKNKYPNTILSIKKAVNKSFMIDNVCHMLFHLGELRTKYYRPDRDLLSPEYKSGKRYVTESQIDFDAVK